MQTTLKNNIIKVHVSQPNLIAYKREMDYTEVHKCML